ncbi:hypothetical protein ARMGADRAFT_1076111 [Armillaria gallica]|uniref:Uncharacterized protein n=1 Tax=Armillaria gallica TaxID=47427 RepID=A0A2H3E1S2_ARMGA|nr:hypothetical protein ARMGADRAFT_1076111 [Armillaria gallica]
MSTVPFEESLRSGVDGFHRSIQDDAKGDTPLEVIDTVEARMSLPPHLPPLSTYLDDLGKIIAGNHSSPASSNDSKELVSNNENLTYLAHVFREAQVDRIFHDALSRYGPLPNGLHGEVDTDYLAYPSAGAESMCAPGCTICGLRSTKLSRQVHSFLSKKHSRMHNTGIDVVNPSLLDTSSQAFLEDYLALHAPIEPESDDNPDVAELNAGTDKVEDVNVDPGDSVTAVEKKGRAKTRARARKRKRKIVHPPKENKDDAKENVPEIIEEPTKDPLRWIRDLPPMKPPFTKEIQENDGGAAADEGPSKPLLPSDEVEWMKKIMKTAYSNEIRPKPRYKPKRN